MTSLLLSLLLGASSALAPAFSPVAGTYSSTQTVSVLPRSSGSVIRCTTDGSTPSTTSPRYLTPYAVAADTTIRCRAWVQGKKTSPVALAAYVISAQPIEMAGSCAGEVMRATGTTTYYCDCQTGAQAGCVAGTGDTVTATADGTITKPFRSWAAAITRFSTMAAGNTVAFCKGGAWLNLNAAVSDIRNQNCRADSSTRPPRAGDVQTCDLRDYQASWGGSNKPMLKFAANQDVLRMGWYQDSAGGWDASKVTGVRVLNLDFVGNNDGSGGVFNIWGRVHQLEICGNTFRDGWNNAYAGATSMTVKYVNFHHNRVTNNPFGIGIVSGTSCIKDCWFDSNYFDLNGGASNRDHTIYAGGSPYEGSNWPTDPDVGPQSQICQGIYQSTSHMCYAVSKGSRITNNEIRRSAWGGGTGCVGSAMVIHGPHDGLLIENNVIYEPPGTAQSGCYGIDQTAGIDMPGAWTNTIIRRNQIYNVHGNGITMGNCQNCVVENNFVYGGSQGIQYPDPGNHCPTVPYPPTALYTCSGNLEDSGGIVRNNTVVSGGDIDLNNYPNPGSVATNNAVCGGSTVGGVTMAGNRSATTSCTTWFQGITNNHATNDFRPAVGSVLIGAGSATSVGTRFQEGTPWSAAATGLAPDSPPTQGAARR